MGWVLLLLLLVCQLLSIELGPGQRSTMVSHGLVLSQLAAAHHSTWHKGALALSLALLALLALYILARAPRAHPALGPGGALH